MGASIASRFVSDAKVELVGAVDVAQQAPTAGTAPPIVSKLGDLPATLRADMILDFSTASAVKENLEPCLKRGWDALIGVTGFSESEMDSFRSLATKYKRRVALVPNFTIGVNLLLRIAKEAARLFRHVEIIEMHHDRKVDAPSGTALYTARTIAENRTASPPGEKGGQQSRGHVECGIPIHSVRMQGLLAHQEVLFGNEGEVLTIRHDTMDRSAFMPGIYLAIEKLPSLEPGFYVGLDWAFDR
jgi:4-hydroxy-tetrahydrodipicolinate reductase